MDGYTMTHEHEKTLIHPRTRKYVCWCQYPFCTEISKLKKRERDVVLIAIYELIKRDKRTNNDGRQTPLERYLSMD